MSNLKFFDITAMIIKEADNQFAPIWRSTSKGMANLKTVCNELDKLCLKNGAESLEVEVDDVTMDISFTMEISKLEFVCNNILLSAAKKISFHTKKESHHIFCTICLNGIWTKAYKLSSKDFPIQ